MVKVLWTLAEIETLKSEYGSVHNKDLAVKMGKSKQAIQHQAHRMNLTTRRIANFKYCVDCGTRLSRASCYKETAERCFPCSMKHHSGEGHHNWKGGIAPLRSLVHVLLKPVWIDPILRRDHFTCQVCHKHGGYFEVHHLRSYRKIRDEVIRENPGVNLHTFEGKKDIALKIVAAHKLIYGITLCVSCHAEIHHEKRGELRESLTVKDEGNPQPNRMNVQKFLIREVQRLTGEDAQTNNPDTSTPHGLPTREEIV